VKRGLVLVEEFDELPNTAGVVKLLRLVGPLIREGDSQSSIQKGHLAKAITQDIQAKRAVVEDLGVGQKRDTGPRPAGFSRFF